MSKTTLIKIRWLVACLVAPLAISMQSVVAQIPDVLGWQLSWHDEFDGTTLNTTNWIALDRQNSFNNEKQYYWHDQVKVAGGNLQLTATNLRRGDKFYQSGLITSNALFGPGRFEARIDLPVTQGMWPAFWLNPNQVRWPLGGEIDVMENRGSEPNTVSSAFHWQQDPTIPCCNAHQFVGNSYSPTTGGNPVNFTTGFHTFAVEWDKIPGTNINEIRYYVDDVIHMTVDENSTMADANFLTPKNIILNLAVGGDFGGDPNGTTIFPQTMLVDYVRYWQRPTGMPGDFNGDHQVDTSDYLAWRKSVGQGGISLPADGSGNGSIGLEDYNVWRQNFGSAAGAGAAATFGVPEPTASGLILLAVILMLLRGQRPAAAIPKPFSQVRKPVGV